MNTLFFDLETFSAVPIQHGTYAYARAARVLLVAWAMNRDPVRVDEWVTEDFRSALAAADRVVIHNSFFDRTILRMAAGIDLDPARIEDTMVLAYLHSLPGGLEELGAALGLDEDEAKLRDGRRLVRLFCVPGEDGLPAATAETHPQEWARFRDYAARDVEAMRTVWRRLPRWNAQPRERKLWMLDQLVNDRGVPVDVALARGALAVAERVEKQLSARARTASRGYVESATQRDRVLEVLRASGLDLPDARASTLERALEDDLHPAVAEFIRLRLAASASSPRKYQRLVDATCFDGRLRGSLQFAGAGRTGRWAGRLFQPQNLPRVQARWRDQLAGWVEATIDGTLDSIEPLVANDASPGVMAILGQLLRSAIRAPEGRRLVGADLSNIEGRVLAWLAGEAWKVRAFEAYDRGAGPDLYKVAAGRILGKRPEDVTADERQARGKVPELACGYGGGQGAFATMAALYGVEYTETQVADIVQRWRAAHPATVAFWRELERALASAAAGTPYRVSGGRLLFDRHGAYVRVRLPSGRFLQYLAPGQDLNGEWSYFGVHPVSRKWERLKTYGGKLAENVVQAVARDVMAEGMLRAEAEGYQVVLTVHDELLTETPDTDRWTGHGLAALMSAPIPWAEGLPLAAAGWHGERWAKA